MKEKYKITDIFGYIPGTKFSLNCIEDIFYRNLLCRSKNIEILGKVATVVWEENVDLTEYYLRTIKFVFREKTPESLLENMIMVVQSLQDEGKKVAYILWDDLIVAAVGYIINDSV